jgi:hypothetical protein
MIEPTHPVQVPTLEQARDQLDAWRSRPHRARRIPDELWDAAVRLCGEHSVCRVSRALGLDYKALRRRYQAAKDPQPLSPFVPLEPLWDPRELVIECDDGHRRHLRIRCRGAVDPRLADLVRAFFEGRR